MSNTNLLSVPGATVEYRSQRWRPLSPPAHLRRGDAAAAVLVLVVVVVVICSCCCRCRRVPCYRSAIFRGGCFLFQKRESACVCAHTQKRLLSHSLTRGDEVQRDRKRCWKGKRLVSWGEKEQSKEKEDLGGSRGAGTDRWVDEWAGRAGRRTTSQKEARLGHPSTLLRPPCCCQC